MTLITALTYGLLVNLVKFAKKRIIVGFREFHSASTSQRALLSYLVHPLLLPTVFRDHVKFSNRGIAQEIPRVLNELGYVVDIVNFDNLSWWPSRHYDLFIGHGGMNFERLSSFLPKSTVRIYFSTGIYWRDFNVRMARRLYDLALRRGYLLPPERFIKYDEEYANQVADGIICLGNQEAVRTYSQFGRVIGINNAIYPATWKGWVDKDYAQGRKHFLFFSGRGNVQKGLDLLLEAFSHTDLHLHICQHMQEDFSCLYEREIRKSPNIHVHGFLKMRSSAFEELVRRCNWTISATCAEGQPGSVIECMGYGLIPIVPKSANIDLEDWGIRLRNCDVETIRSTVFQASKMKIEECKQLSVRTIKATERSYSVENFRSSFKQAVTEILASVNTERTSNKSQ